MHDSMTNAINEVAMTSCGVTSSFYPCSYCSFFYFIFLLSGSLASCLLDFTRLRVQYLSVYMQCPNDNNQVITTTTL